MVYVIPEVKVEGKPLGRHVHHDPRSKQYPFEATGVTLVSKRWSKDSDLVLDQGNLGSCTGNATTGALICSNGNPLNTALSDAQRKSLNETLAVKIYSRATETDPVSGSYPPDDTGSDGVDVAKAAKQFGYISGYKHSFSKTSVLEALQVGPVILGINWTTGFDNPDANGLVKVDGSVRGGHEICLDEIDVENQLVWFRNSWSSLWGVDGRACFSWDDLEALLQDQGDATVFVALSQPAPTPVPVPTADEALAEAVSAWVENKKVYAKNEAVRQALLAWLAAKNL